MRTGRKAEVHRSGGSLAPPSGRPQSLALMQQAEIDGLDEVERPENPQEGEKDLELDNEMIEAWLQEQEGYQPKPILEELRKR